MVRFIRNLDKAVTFLVENVRDPNDDPRHARDKLRKRILHALGNGDLRVSDMLFDSGDGPLPPPQFIAWARQKWPEQLQRFAALQTGVAKEGFRVRDTSYGDVLPGDIEKCQDYLQTAYSGLRALGKDLHAALSEIERLKIIEAKYEAIREKNRQNARQPRKE